jgi:branched-chain amino acid transport system substrate-binding protein
MINAKRLWTGLMILTLMGGLLSCGGTTVPTSGPQAQPNATSAPAPIATAAPVTTIKVGALYPLSGELSKIGEDVRNGLTLAIEDVNAAGGIKSLGGAKIELVFGDSQGKPDIGISEVERLIQQEGVVMVVGCYNSSVTLPASQAAQRLQTPFLDDTAISDEITDRGYEWVFRIVGKASWYARDQVAFVQDLKNLAGYEVKKVALLHENTDFGESTAEGQKKYLAEAKIEIVAEVTYPSNAADLSTEVAKVQASNPDAVLTVTYLNDGVLIAQAREKLGMTNIPFIDSAGGTIDPDFIKRLGQTAEGMFSLVEFSKYAKGSDKANQHFLDRWGADMTGNSVNAYNAGVVVADALERAASTDKAKIRQALSTTSLSGDVVITPSHKIEFGPDGQNKYAQLYVGQVLNGVLMPVWPQAIAAAEVKLTK